MEGREVESYPWCVFIGEPIEPQTAHRQERFSSGAMNTADENLSVCVLSGARRAPFLQFLVCFQNSQREERREKEMRIYREGGHNCRAIAICLLLALEIHSGCVV